MRQPLAVEEAASPHNNLGCGCRDGVRDWIGVFLLPRVPLYPQGVRRIRRAAEPPTAAQSLRAAPAVAALLSPKTAHPKAFPLGGRWLAAGQTDEGPACRREKNHADFPERL